MSATDKKKDHAKELKRRSRGISSDMSPAAIEKRLQPTVDLCEAAEFLSKNSKPAGTSGDRKSSSFPKL